MDIAYFAHKAGGQIQSIHIGGGEILLKYKS